MAAVDKSVYKERQRTLLIFSAALTTCSLPYVNACALAMRRLLSM